MDYYVEIMISIHLLVFILLYFFCKRTNYMNIGFLTTMLGMGVIKFIYQLINNDYDFRGTIFAIAFPAIVLLIMAFTDILSENKQQKGTDLFSAFIQTDIKYMCMLFWLSLLINMHFNISHDVYDYLIFSLIFAFVFSVFFCKRVNNLSQTNEFK